MLAGLLDRSEAGITTRLVRLDCVTDRAEAIMADYQRGVEASTSWAEGH